MPAEMSQPAGGTEGAACASGYADLLGAHWKSDVLLGQSQTEMASSAFLSTPPGLRAGAPDRNAMSLLPDR